MKNKYVFKQKCYEAFYPEDLSKDNFNSGTAAGGSVALILHRCAAFESCDMGI